MKIKNLLLAAVALSAATVWSYDLKTVELVPVKFEKAPSHAPVKMVETGKLNFAIVADLKAEKRMRAAKKSRSEESIAPAIEILTEAIEKCTGVKPQVLDIKDAAKAKYMIVLGDNAITRANGIDVKKLPTQGFAIKTGNRWRLFCLHVSFIGWAILCAFTLGIGNLWLNPYKNAATATFYREVSGTEQPTIQSPQNNSSVWTEN